MFLQPRAHNPTGITMTPRRGKELAAVLAAGQAVVVEDDHSGDIASGALVSLGKWLPTRTVHIRSYSKSHGPDLRLAAVGGAGDVVSAVANRRLLGAGWSSRILQAVLLEMLEHQPTIDAVAAARAESAARRPAVTEVLAAAGVGFTGTDGINLWMQVANRRFRPPHPCRAGHRRRTRRAVHGPRRHAPSIRVTVGLIEHDDRGSAARLAEAAGNQPSRSGQR